MVSPARSFHAIAQLPSNLALLCVRLRADEEAIVAGRRVLRTTGFLLATTSVAALMTVPSAVADPASASPMTRSCRSACVGLPAAPRARSWRR